MDLTLRKQALEVIGWTFKQDDGWTGGYRWAAINPDGVTRLQAWASIDNMLPELPAIESDEGVAIRALVEWCNSASLDFDIVARRTDNGRIFECVIALRYSAPTGESRNLAEAICRALIEAAKGQSK